MDSSGFRLSANVEDRRDDLGFERYRQSIAAQLRNPGLDPLTRARFEDFLRSSQPYDPITGTGGSSRPSAPPRPELDMAATTFESSPAYFPDKHGVRSGAEVQAHLQRTEADDLRFNEEMSRLITPRRLAEELMRR
jgi:hypothetical protein